MLIGDIIRQPYRDYILDTLVDQPLYAYSTRKLKNSATKCIRMRRSSDNTEKDIGFDDNGNLDVRTMKNFNSAYNGLVTIWYDQSGNNYDAVQTDITKQPRIMQSGSILTGGVNLRPPIFFPRAYNEHLYIPIIDYINNAITVNITIDPKNAAPIYWFSKNKKPAIGQKLGSGEIEYSLVGTTTELGTLAAGYGPGVYTTVQNGTTSAKGYLNGVQKFSFVPTISVNETTDAYIGASSPTANIFWGYFNELMVFNTAISDTDRTNLESNQKNYYLVT